MENKFIKKKKKKKNTWSWLGEGFYAAGPTCPEEHKGTNVNCDP